MNIPAEVKQIITQLNNNGYEAYIVGGCVRDHILGMKPKDWDITTSALPEDVKSLFPHTFDTGIAHGTITVVINHCNFEVTTYRIDGEYKDNRHPEEVIFTDKLSGDLSRRDFTMNAIAYNDPKGYVDLFGGIEDIHKGIIRGVGIPAKRFQEDALRMLRALRFSAQLGFDIEIDTLNALIDNAHLITNISIERIRDEFLKLLISPHPEKLTSVKDTGLLQYFLPELCSILNKQQNTLIPILVSSPNDTILRLSILFNTLDKKQVQKILKHLRLDNNTINNTSLLTEYAHYNIPEELYSVRHTLSLIGSDTFKQLIILKKLLYPEQNNELNTISAMYKEIVKNNDCYNLKHLAVNGNDIKSAGIAAGKSIGIKLNQALDIVLHDPDKNKKDILINLLKN